MTHFSRQTFDSFFEGEKNRTARLAALEVARSEHKVYLVEREPGIGGHVAQLEKTFPKLDSSSRILSHKMNLVGSNEYIELMTNSDWRDHVVEQVLWNRAAWFEALDCRQVIENWLRSGNDDDIALAILAVRLF